MGNFLIYNLGSNSEESEDLVNQATTYEFEHVKISKLGSDYVHIICHNGYNCSNLGYVNYETPGYELLTHEFKWLLMGKSDGKVVNIESVDTFSCVISGKVRKLVNNQLILDHRKVESSTHNVWLGDIGIYSTVDYGNKFLCHFEDGRLVVDDSIN